MAKAITAKARSLRPSLKDAKHIERSRFRHPARQPPGHPARGADGIRGRGRRDHGAPLRKDHQPGDPLHPRRARPGPAHLATRPPGDAYTATIDARAAVGRTWIDGPAADRPRRADDVVEPPRRRQDPRRCRTPGRALPRRAAWTPASRATSGPRPRQQHPVPAVPGRRRSTSGRSPTSWPGSPSPPTAPRSTSCATTASPRSPPSSRAPSRGRPRRATASTRRPGSTPQLLLDTEIAAWVTPQQGRAGVHARRRSSPPATRCTCCRRTAEAAPAR